MYKGLTSSRLSSNKKLHDSDYPSSGMVLSAKFNDAIRNNIDRGIVDKTLRWITEEEKVAEGYMEYRPVILLKTKRIKKTNVD